MDNIVTTVNHYYLDFTQWFSGQPVFSWYDTFVSRFANTRGKRITIGLAVFLFVTGHSIRRAVTPPKKLKHLPYIPFFEFLNNFAIKKLNVKEFNDLNKPYIEKYNGFLEFDPSGWVYHIADPVAIKKILLKADLFPKYENSLEKGTYIEQFTGSDNILFSSGKEWIKHRKLVNPAFHKSFPVLLFGEAVHDLFSVFEEDYPQDEFTLDVTHYFNRLTLQIIGKAGFGFDFNSIKDEKSKWHVIYSDIIEYARNPLFLILPKLELNFLWLFPKRREEFKTLDKWKGVLLQVIESKREELKNHTSQEIEESEKDILSLMLEGELRGEGVLTNEELINDIAVFFAAGHDTTSVASSATIGYLAKHPEIQEKARQEAIRIIYPNGEQKTNASITIAQTKEFVYINQIIKEVLRMHPPIVFLISPRKVTQDVDLNGVFLPKGTLVTPDIYSLHRNPNVWKDPETFNPDRWEAGGEAEKLMSEGMPFIPFSDGDRKCIGSNFSLLEQRVILANFCKYWFLLHVYISKYRI
ncbi:unnamed protein product [Cunninghamella blakesleeana]